ncbi:MAG TPA: helix-hairpin-helix domain-containing protein [Flavisolibacter sp.]|jgi:DNA uptake protein ComE-like DNA-binding protein|nr:helix-hairpin-helix domain-containing protein [Flavisolibacter sp.]
MKKFLSEYLRFSKKERWGLFSFVTVLVLLCFLPDWIGNSPADLQEVKLLSSTLDSTLSGSAEPGNDKETYSRYKSHDEKESGFSNKELFYFDPNTISASDWQRLGLNVRTAETIEHYKAKGGRFRKPEDLKKIWGLPPAFFERIQSYIRIDNPEVPSYPAAKNYHSSTTVLQVMLNKSDTADWIALPGIGSKLANRIIRFREKLGGFYAIEQVSETYGLSDSVFQTIKKQLVLDAGLITKIDINTATKEILKEHPYIRWNLAAAIIEYRNQHGPFTALDQIRNIQLVDEKTFLRLQPYLTLQ